MTPYEDEIIGDYEYGFWHNISATDQIFYICQIMKKIFEYNGRIHQLFIDSEKAYDPIRRDVLYNILIEFYTHMKLVRLIKMCLNETYSKVSIGKNLSNAFPV
jgi:hypothetical protein